MEYQLLKYEAEAVIYFLFFETMRTRLPKTIWTALIASGIKIIYFPICFVDASSEITAKTPHTITINSKVENTQTKILKTIRSVREINRAGMISSIK